MWECVKLLYVKLVCVKLLYVSLCVKLLYVKFVCVKFLCECVCVCEVKLLYVSVCAGGVREEAREEEEEAPGITESKTRTPHKVVGKNQPFEDAQKLLPGHEGGLGSEWAGSLGEGLWIVPKSAGIIHAYMYLNIYTYIGVCACKYN